MVRGEIYWIKAVLTTGSEQGSEQGVKNRPAVIIQNDLGNKFSPTVIVAYITSNVSKNQSTHSKCAFGTVLTEQLATVCKSRVDTYMGTLSKQEIVDMENALSVSINLKPRSLSLIDMIKEQQVITNNETLGLESKLKSIKELLEALTNKHIGLQYALEALSVEKAPSSTIELDIPEPIETEKVTAKTLPVISNPLAREIAAYMLEHKKEVTINELTKNLKSKPSRARVSDTIYKCLKATGMLVPIGRGTYKLSDEIMEAL